MGKQTLVERAFIRFMKENSLYYSCRKYINKTIIENSISNINPYNGFLQNIKIQLNRTYLFDKGKNKNVNIMSTLDRMCFYNNVFEQILFNLFVDKIKKFFIDNNAIDNFEQNMSKTLYGHTFDDYIAYYYNSRLPLAHFVNLAFSWGSSKEGREYWCNIHDRYIIFIIDLMKTTYA